jgi:ubiquinone biosynthesis protein
MLWFLFTTSIYFFGINTLGLRDPHPGNILALPGEVIAFMDFGIVGRLTPEMKNHVASFVIAMMNQSTDEVVRTITSMGLVP